jgi:hypothetical protein
MYPGMSDGGSRKQVSGTVPSFIVRDVIGLMDIKCPNHNGDIQRNKRTKSNDGQAVATSDGCKWLGKCEDLQEHEKVCSFEMLTFPIEGCDHQCRRKDMASHLSGEGLIYHMKLIKQSMASDYEKKLSECNKKIDSVNKKLNAAQKEIKTLKKKLSDLKATESQASTLSDDNEDKGVKVKVEGCRIAEINGTYKQFGMYGGKPKFSKSGQWNGEDVNFVIYWDHCMWYIIICHNDGEF